MARRVTWREALEEAIGDGGVTALTDLAVEALAQETDLLEDDPDMRALARSSSAANVALVAELARGSLQLADVVPPPQAAAFARELARRNTPMAELARAYRIVQHALWRYGVKQIRARMDVEQAAAAVEEFTDATFATGESLMGSALDRYALERERWVRSADAVRRATVEELLQGGTTDTGVASGRLRYELRREHVAFLVWSDEEEAALENAAALVGGQGALLVPLGVGVVAGWSSALTKTPVPDGVRIAVGSPGDGLEGFRRSHAEALEARRVARLSATPGVVRYPDVALVALLTKDAEQARAFSRRILGPLSEHDATTTRLADTVLAVLDAQGSPRHAAQRLNVHENTVAKRIRVAEQTLGRSIAYQPAELMAALLIRRATR
jgi:DNA-binding PucR family transcriptional regulator